MLKFRGMDRSSFIAFIFIFLFVSQSCNASLAFHVRELIASAPINASATSQVSPPTGSPVNKSVSTATNVGKDNNQTNSNRTSPIDSKGSNKNDGGNKNPTAPSPPAVEKNGNTVDKGNGKAANATAPNSGNNDSCKGSLTSCRDQEMIACIEASKGSKQMFIVVQNEGETTLKVNVKLPNYLTIDLPAFEVSKHKTRRVDISSTVGKSTELIVDSGNANCTLELARRSVSVDDLVQQLSFYSKQVTPIYAAYASIIVALLFLGTWACCKLRKRNQENGIPYQELEMGLPESVNAVNADATEGWDNDWDDDDWDEDNVVKSPAGGQHVRSVSVDGLTSRPSKKDGWEDDWDD
ncbi:hypothetical protein PHJA_000885000 [Phtheirospermum japonicum]|uniref:DUF7356 domain-containing protein n=1 Tax=Phtheirospermum japonicum TaxID=374723 RepID=A0A830BTV7_9LAMI|nr:hypothetical protein PHJA_000885000 [Phtheirospermum japonicum]